MNTCYRFEPLYFSDSKKKVTAWVQKNGKVRHWRKMRLLVGLNLNSLEFIQDTFIEHLPLGRYTMPIAFENTMMYKEAWWSNPFLK